MYRVITLLFVLAICLTAAVPQAQATLITANGTTVFSDGSENSTVGVIPALTDPSVGAWADDSVGTPRILTLTGADAGGAPGAFSGDNYLVIQRVGSGNKPFWSATFDAVDPATTALRAEFMIFIKAASTQYPSASFQKSPPDPNAAGNTLTNIIFGLPSGTDIYNTASGGAIPGLHFSDDVWNKVVLDWDPARSTTLMRLTVNSDTVDVSVHDTLPTEITCLTFGNHGNGTRYYIDAVVPEPSTLALLATGLIGLLCYAWRKRK